MKGDRVLGAVIGVLLTLVSAASADVFNMGPGLTSLEFVRVGDPGNAGRPVGAVAYEYQIGKFEVTNAQYCEFLNAVARTADPFGLYSDKMATSEQGGIVREVPDGEYIYDFKSGYGNKPATYVSWLDGLRFANWLHNGQPTGPADASTTEDGAYTFTGPETAGARNEGAVVWLPSDHEWYKAAYYKSEGTVAGYWEYATQSSTPPIAEPPPGGGNSANYDYAVDGHHLTDAGAYAGSMSAYGTYDQNGSVWEWVEEAGVVRGGAYSYAAHDMSASHQDTANPGATLPHFGFRVATQPGPAEAEAGGPYTIGSGGTLRLDASETFGATEPTYQWDVNDDGTPETDAGSQSILDLPYSWLASLGLGPGEHTIHLLVTDALGWRGTDSSLLTIFTTGDANGDGYVDDDDLSLLLSNWTGAGGSGGTWATGDFDQDGGVSDDDLSLLLGNWTGPPPPGAAVPEPGTLALLTVGGVALIRRRHLRARAYQGSTGSMVLVGDRVRSLRTRKLLKPKGAEQ